MNKRGFGTTELVVAVAVAGLVAAAVIGVRAWIISYGGKEFTAGELKERSLWQGRENTELASKNAKIEELEQRYRALERKSADDMQTISLELEAAKGEVEDAKQKYLAALASGAPGRLRWGPIYPAASGIGSCGGSASAPCAARPGGDATPYCELPPAVEERLVGIADDADQVAIDLIAAQKIIRKDREVCK